MKRNKPMLSLSRIRLAIAIATTLAVPVCLFGQNAKPEPKSGIIIGTATDVNGDPVPNATVQLKSFDSSDRRTVTTPESGSFQFRDVQSGVPYEINISAQDFADWRSSSMTLSPGQFKIVTGIQMQIKTELTQIDVKYDPVQVATEQLKAEEHQRVFGFVPNFYVSYEKNPAPLTAKMKFQLALKVSIDPVTAAGVLGMAGIRQAANSPKYGQGWGAYGKRFGATAADGFSDIMIGGAILPSLLHQDPRYFYQGTGTTGSRIRHAVFSPFVARSDSGKLMPNYSSVGGNLAAAGLSNLYFPRANRGVGLVFGNFAIGTAERIGASLAQEFIIGKFTKRSGHMQ
jgi:Carboxypeptidase regulatory-like domain